MSSPRRWTDQEDALLLAEYASGNGPALAVRLSRTPAAVNIRVRDLGLSKRTPLRITWTAQADAMLRAHYQRMPVTELAERLGTTPGAVMKRAGILRLGKLITRDQFEIARLKAENERLKAGATLSDDARRLAVLVAVCRGFVTSGEASRALDIAPDALHGVLVRAATAGFRIVTDYQEGVP